jgi:hypothetical protein
LILLAVSFFPSFLTKCMSRVCVCVYRRACVRVCVPSASWHSHRTWLDWPISWFFWKTIPPLLKNPSILDASSNAMPAGERPLVMRWKRRRGQRKRKKRETRDTYIYV